MLNKFAFFDRYKVMADFDIYFKMLTGNGITVLLQTKNSSVSQILFSKTIVFLVAFGPPSRIL